jgi:hypothetical protein
MIDGTRVIDFHGHSGNWDWTGMRDDPERILPTMDACGIDQACLFNIFDPDGTDGNNRTAELVTAHPDRFIGFAYASPLSPRPAAEELTRAIDELKFAAIKIYPPYGEIHLDDRRWDPIFEFADERQLVVIAHTDAFPSNRPRLLGEAARRFPRAIFVSGHTGNLPEPRLEAIEAANAYPNFYLETCSTFRTPGVIEQIVSSVGADRVLYGSDLPLMDPRCQIGKIITADISDDDKRKVLGENAARLLKLN